MVYVNETIVIKSSSVKQFKLFSQAPQVVQ